MAAVPSIGRASAIEPRPSGEEAQATSLLYERYSRQIFNFCLHKLGSREEAEDAAQSTFLNALRGMQRGVRPDLEQAWLFKIAENVCLTRHRSTFRRRRVESPSDFDALQEVVSSPPKDADTLIRLSDALSEMSDQQRRALLLREWQGLSYREIGDELGLSQAAVETLLFRARRSLASGLTEAPQKKRGAARLRSGLDLGAILAAAKAAFAGSAAVKVAAVTAIATTTAIAGSKVEKIEHAQALKRHVAATVAKAPARQAHLRRSVSSAAAPASVVTRAAGPASKAHAHARVVSRPQAVALVPNRATDDVGESPPTPAAPVHVAASVAPVDAQAAEPPPTASAPATTPAVTQDRSSWRDEKKAELQKPEQKAPEQKGTEQNQLDRGLSAAPVPPAAPTAPATKTEQKPSDPWSGGNDHGKRNDRTDRRAKFTAAPVPAPAPAPTEVAPAEPPAVEQSDSTKGTWKQNDKKWNWPAPAATAPTPAPATTPAAPATAASPMTTEPTVAAPMPTDHGRKGKDRKEAPAPIAPPTDAAAAPAPTQSEGKGNGQSWGRHR